MKIADLFKIFGEVIVEHWGMWLGILVGGIVIAVINHYDRKHSTDWWMNRGEK